MEAILSFMSEQSFMPHGHCYLWTPVLVWMQVLSNGAIGLAYVAISLTLAALVTRVQGLPFRWVYVAFGVFIVTCGLTHFMDVWVIWTPRYWLDAFLRVITALASVGTALLLPRLLPRAVTLVNSARRVQERGVELQAALSDLETMYAKTRELDELKSSFFANVSHELRTPLTLVLGPLEHMLRADNLTSEQRASMELASRNAKLLLTHVNDFLELAKLDAGQLEASYSAFDLSELVRQVAACFETLASEKQIELAVRVPSERRVELDRDKLQRVLLNLLSNALKFTPRGGRVTCEVDDASADRVRIAVSDNGPGIPAAQRKAVFERFRQVDSSSSRAFGGTGLGLAIVKELVDLQQGTVRATEAAEGGARLEIELPTRAPAGVSLRSPEPSPLPRPADLVPQEAPAVVTRPESPSAPLVLLAEDNADMREYVRSVLGALYRVETAVDGSEALSKACALLPDLVISDVMMPGMSGEQLVHAIRSEPTLDGVPILLLTAKADEDLRARALRSGAQDFLLKPFSTPELVARVDNLVAVKRSRDVLRSALSAQQQDLETLSRAVVSHKQALEAALEAARAARKLAEQSSEAKSDFLRLVSHELRTPLTSIVLQVERLRHAGTRTREELDRIVGRLERSSQRLLKLIESMIELSDLESGRPEVHVVESDLGQLLREVVRELEPEAQRKNLHVHIDTRGTSMVARTDPRLARLVLTSLIENAIRFTDRGVVEVTLENAADRARVTIRDTGPGIAPAEQARVFEAFEQLEPVVHKHKVGLGVGLALARSVLRLLGGGIELESELGAGSTFTITLPALEPSALSA